MLRITDKSFQYTPSTHTDLKKKFRKIAQAQRAAEASSKAAEAALAGSVVTMIARRGQASK